MMEGLAAVGVVVVRVRGGEVGVEVGSIVRHVIDWQQR